MVLVNPVYRCTTHKHALGEGIMLGLSMRVNYTY